MSKLDIVEYRIHTVNQQIPSTDKEYKQLLCEAKLLPRYSRIYTHRRKDRRAFRLDYRKYTGDNTFSQPPTDLELIGALRKQSDSFSFRV